MHRRTVAAIVALALTSCDSRREIVPTLGTSSPPSWEYTRAAVERPAPSGALSVEWEAARRAIDAGMIDPQRLDRVRCGNSVGWRSGAVVIPLEGTALEARDCDRAASNDVAELEREISQREQPVRDPVARALLLRAGVSASALARGADPRADRDSVVRAWAHRMWQGAVEYYTGRVVRVRRDGVARQLLHAARYAIGQVERSGASASSVRATFAFAETARDLDEQRWLVARAAGPQADDSNGDDRRLPALAVNGWSDDRGDSTVELIMPSLCPDEVRRNRALRYRPTSEMFLTAQRAAVLTEWRALEGLLQRLHGGRSMARALIAACDEREFDRPARGYEVAYVLLAAAVGYDALAPNELSRFERGDVRLLLELETRFRERITQLGFGREPLARAHLDQDALRVLWPASARALAVFHRTRQADASGAASMQRSRDAARVIAAARSAAIDNADRCRMLLDAIEIDLPTAREAAPALARSVLDEAPAALAGYGGCAGKLIARLHRAGLLRAGDELPRLLDRLGLWATDADPLELLASLSEDPNAAGAWTPTQAHFGGDCSGHGRCARWLSRPALQWFVRSPSLRSWALRWLDSQEIPTEFAMPINAPNACRSVMSQQLRYITACTFWSQLPRTDANQPTTVSGAIDLARSILNPPGA